MDQSKPIEIRMDFNLLRIRNFDDISGELGLTGYFKIQWKDEILSITGLILAFPVFVIMLYSDVIL
jgi:hypothetical protein